MRSGTRIGALALLFPLLAGCAHRQKAMAPPPAAQAPSRPPTEMSTLASPMPPPVQVETEHPLKLDATTPPEPPPTTPPRPKRIIRRHPKPPAQETAQQQHASEATSQNAAQNAPAQTAPRPTSEVAASGQPAEMSPIGQLSTTNDGANTADRHNIATQIDQTETGVNAIKRALNSEEQKTVAQIRTFISRARDALKADDLDGARTLSTKAKLLLQELTKE